MNNDNQRIKNVVIAGGGTAGWIAAAGFSRLLGKSVNVTLVESEAIGTIGVGEATIPPIRTLHKMLGIDEKEFMRETNATFKLGIQFEGWRNAEHDYIHSFGVTGRECWAGEFHHFWLRAKQMGIAKPFGNYCFELMAANENKFGWDQQQGINFAYHLDATRYAKYLRRLSEGWGVKRVEGKIEAVKTHQNGEIASLVMAETGQEISGDFFVDCTGFRALLIGKTLRSTYTDWSNWLLADRAIALQTESTEPARPYTRSIAHQAGWQWQIPLQNRVGNGFVYASQYQSEADAEQLLVDNVTGAHTTSPRHLQFTPGVRYQAWVKNCVAIGLSSGFIEPLESTSIHLIMTALVRLMRLFPFDGINQSAIDDYNQKYRSEMHAIRDFIIMHYKVNSRTGSDMWQYYRNMSVPDSLQHKLNLFAETGRVFLDDGDVFRVDSWTQVMMGQGLEPHAYHRIADEMPEQELTRFMTTIEQHVAKSVARLPEHESFIQKLLG